MSAFEHQMYIMMLSLMPDLELKVLPNVPKQKKKPMPFIQDKLSKTQGKRL